MWYYKVCDPSKHFAKSLNLIALQYFITLYFFNVFNNPPILCICDVSICYLLKLVTALVSSLPAHLFIH